MKFAILLALVASATAVPLMYDSSPLNPVGRIVGGQAISIDQVPWQVVLVIFGNRRCGGSIISENWVLTAAHCLVFPTNWYTVRAGSSFATSGGSTHPAATLISHADYFEDRFRIPHDDIGLIQVQTAFVFGSTRAPIALYNAGEEAVAGSPALVSGWGYVTEEGPWTDILQAVSVPIVSQSVCNLAYAEFGGIPARQICAGFATGAKDACGGDSGGPLVINGRLAGAVSWGNGCAREGYYGVYAEVASYREWIRQNSGV